jgi:hypothetical protein
MSIYLCAVFFFFLGIVVGKLLEVLIRKARNTKLCQSYIVNTPLGILDSGKTCPYWQKTLCRANVYRDHKMCKGCPHYTGDIQD